MFHTQVIFGSRETAICAHIEHDDAVGRLRCIFWLGGGYSPRFGTCMSERNPVTTRIDNPERFGHVTDEASFREFVAAFVSE